MPRTSTRIRRLGEPVLVLMDTDDDWQPGTVIRCIAADRDADWLYVIELESSTAPMQSQRVVITIINESMRAWTWASVSAFVEFAKFSEFIS